MRTYSDPVKLPGRHKYVSRVYDKETHDRTWVSTGCEKLKDAKAWVDTRRMEEALGPERVRAAKSSTKTFGEVLDAWLAEKEAKTSAGRYTTYRAAADRYWRPIFGRKRLSEITTEMLQGYSVKRQRGTLLRPAKAPAKPTRARKSGRKPKAGPRVLAAATVNGDLAALRAIFNFAIKNRWTRENPLLGVERFSGEMRRRTRRLSAEDEAKLLAACREGAVIEVAARRNAGGRHGGKTRDAKGRWKQRVPVPDYLHPLVLTLARCGFRKRTALGLRWGHLDFARGEWRIPAELTKTREDYDAPVPASVLEELRAYRQRLAEKCAERGTNPVERIGPEATIFGLTEDSSVKRAFGRAVKRAGFAFHLSMHDLRRNFLNQLRQRGVGLEVAMRLSGHRNVSTVMKHYAEVGRDEMASAIRAIDAPASPPRDATNDSERTGG